MSNYGRNGIRNRVLMVRIGKKTAVALFALFAYLIHGIVEMSIEIGDDLRSRNELSIPSHR